MAIYPSINLPLAEKAIQFYTNNLPKNDMEEIILCLRLIGFGMRSTLLNFQDTYNKYEDEGLEKKKD